jgi:hypothetical protein
LEIRRRIVETENPTRTAAFHEDKLSFLTVIGMSAIKRFRRIEKWTMYANVLSFIVVLLVAIAISAQESRYQIDKHADFSRYKTYKWTDTLLAGHANQIVEEQITDAIESELAQKGLRKTDSIAADLLIGYQAALGIPTEPTPLQTRSKDSTPSDYAGRLALEMHDSATKKLVWRGTVTKLIDPRAKLNTQQANVAKAIQKLLSNYPPRKD